MKVDLLNNIPNKYSKNTLQDFSKCGFSYVKHTFSEIHVDTEISPEWFQKDIKMTPEADQRSAYGPRLEPTDLDWSQRGPKVPECGRGSWAVLWLRFALRELPVGAGWHWRKNPHTAGCGCRQLSQWGTLAHSSATTVASILSWTVALVRVKGDILALQKLWKHSPLGQACKLSVFRALIEAKLYYCLPCAVFSKAALRRLDGV